MNLSSPKLRVSITFTLKIKTEKKINYEEGKCYQILKLLLFIFSFFFIPHFLLIPLKVDQSKPQQDTKIK